jgi:hypothetical protein
MYFKRIRDRVHGTLFFPFRKKFAQRGFAQHAVIAGRGIAVPLFSSWLPVVLSWHQFVTTLRPNISFAATLCIASVYNSASKNASFFIFSYFDAFAKRQPILFAPGFSFSSQRFLQIINHKAHFVMLR